MADLQTHHGQSLHIGENLGELARSVGLPILHAGRREFDPPASVMAALLAMDLPTWRQAPHAREHFDARELTQLRVELESIARGHSTADPIEVSFGELVVGA